MGQKKYQLVIQQACESVFARSMLNFAADAIRTLASLYTIEGTKDFMKGVRR
jgi:hypothetical protein